MRLLQDEMAKKLPETVVTKAEGTYLAWLDLSFLGMTDAGTCFICKRQGED